MASATCLDLKYVAIPSGRRFHGSIIYSNGVMEKQEAGSSLPSDIANPFSRIKQLGLKLLKLLLWLAPEHCTAAR
jgi:hypothetical protein